MCCVTGMASVELHIFKQNYYTIIPRTVLVKQINDPHIPNCVTHVFCPNDTGHLLGEDNPSCTS